MNEKELKLLQQIWHPKNKISIHETTKGSHTKFWWKCSKNKEHEWQARINAILRGVLSKHKGCPFCRGLKVNTTNCLATTHPNLAKQWHPTKNKIKIEEVTAGSQKKAYWICENKHEWEAIIGSRTKGNKCPFCSNRLIDKTNCLSNTHPNLAKEWHHKNKISADEIAAGSGVKVWWKCPIAEDHVWKTSPSKRILGRGCPCCCGSKIVLSNCLTTLYPEIAKEWHVNNKISSNEVSPGSQKKYKWICSFGHEWSATVSNRTKNKTGCPICSQSRGELAICKILEELGVEYERQKKFSTCKCKRSLPFDFYLIKEHILIEYQGIQHYKPTGFGGNADSAFLGVKVRDKIKKEWCKNNIKLITIPYWKLNDITDILNNLINTNKHFTGAETNEKDII